MHATLRPYPPTSITTHQAHEDALHEGSRTTQQAYEDTRGRAFFRPTAIRRRASIELENGPRQNVNAQQPVNHATLHTRASRQDTSTGIPYARFKPYHLPKNGAPLRIRNDPEDSLEDLPLNQPPTKQDEHANPFETHSETAKHEDFPELSEYARHDDPASQSRRAQNLLRASQRVAKTAKENLFYAIRERDDRSKTKKYVLNVATMQAAAIRYYQTMIVEYGAEMRNGGVYGEMPDVLHKYCDALRDMDYMQEKASNGFDHDPFLLMTTKQMEREMMLDSGLITAHEMVDGLPPAFDKSNPALPGVGRTARVHATEARARTINLLCALLGGLALIIPMIIMKLVPTQACVLVTTTSFVLAFALVIALLSGLKPNEVLAVTAAYAAVLVVFVGAQSDTNGSSVLS